MITVPHLVEFPAFGEDLNENSIRWRPKTLLLGRSCRADHLRFFLFFGFRLAARPKRSRTSAKRFRLTFKRTRLFNFVNMAAGTRTRPE